MENKTAEEIFCKVYTEFYGEPIDKAEQITEHRFNGNELMEFCEFYASQQKTDIEWLSSEEIRKESLVGYVNDTAGSLNFQLGAKWAQSELKNRIKPSQQLVEKDKEIEEIVIKAMHTVFQWVNIDNDNRVLGDVINDYLESLNK